jgi:DNA helicase HerA-like ATPase
MNLPVPASHPAVDISQIQKELPHRLLTALERRWYENFDINDYAVVPYHGGNMQSEVRFVQIREVVHGPDVTQSLHPHNMQNVISSLRDGSHSLLYAVHGDGHDVKLYMGVRVLPHATHPFSTDEYMRILQRSLRSNYPGIVMGDEPVDLEDYRRDILFPVAKAENFLACITGIPSMKGADPSSDYFTQGIERLVDGLRDETYTLLIVAEPMTDRRVAEIQAQVRQLIEEIHAVVRQSVSRFGSKAESDSKGEAVSYSVTLGALISALFGASWGQTQSTTVTATTSMGGSISHEALDKTAEFCEQALEQFLTRLQNGRNLGFWNAGVYLASPDRHTLLRANGIARSLYAGRQTHFEPLRVLDLTTVGHEAREAVFRLVNPRLRSVSNFLHPLGDEFQSLGTPLTTDELSILVGLPHSEVPGLKLNPVADFNLNPPLGQDLEIGNLLYRGEELAQRPVTISLKALASHAFVSGITGAGKTNTCMILLKAAWEKNKPFLVIEPAKTEYRGLLADDQFGAELQVFTLGDDSGTPFRLNPFEFEPGFNLLTHIDLLKAVFNAAFPMYASMPYLLEDAILQIYADRGWDLVRSSNSYFDHDLGADVRDYLPTLSDLFNQIEPAVLSKGYDARLSHDLTAALKSRIQSLTLGGKGMMLNTQRSVPFSLLLTRPTILELQEIGDDDEKAFVMALLLIRLYEYCRQQRREASGTLQHLTLIEEAHRLLKNISASTSAEVGNARGKAVEMFTDILAEIREYGEGFIIVDQIPSKLTPDVVKNTNLKILHRVVAQDDRDFVGNAMGLTPEQNLHIVRLKEGQAIVHSSEMYTPVLTKIHRVNKGELKRRLLHGEANSLDSDQRFHDATSIHYRRWPGCACCEQPCAFLSGSNEPRAREIALFQQFLSAVLFSEPRVLAEKWQELLSATITELSVRYNANDWEKESRGILICHFVQLSRNATAAYYDYYRSSTRYGYRALVTLERQLTMLVRGLLDTKTIPAGLLAEIRADYREKMAQSPRVEMLGCAHCPMRCHYGLLVQRHPQMQPEVRPHLQRLFEQRIKQAGENAPARGAFGRLKYLSRTIIDFSREVTDEIDIDVSEQELPYLAYCFLSNLTTNVRVLHSFRHAVARGLVTKGEFHVEDR